MQLNFRHCVTAICCAWLLGTACTSEHEVLLSAARSGNTATRVKAIEKLAAGKWDEKTENVVVDALTDVNSLVRKTAAEALAGRGLSVAWPLVRRLRDGDPRVRVQVVKSLHTLPAADYIVTALIRALQDPSQAVRREAAAGFVRRGWSQGEILVWQGFDERMRALEGLAAAAVMDRAAGLERLGQLRAPQDFGFLLAALHHSDGFMIQTAAKALAHGGEPELLGHILAAGGNEPEPLPAVWLEAANRVDPAALDALFRRLPRETLVPILLRKNLRLPCSLLTNLPDPELVTQVEPGCQVDDAWPLDVRFSYLKLHAGDNGLAQEALGRLDELSAVSLRLLAADPAAAPALAAWARRAWERYVFEYQKWIPERTWQALDLVSPTDEDALPKPPADDVSRLLDVYRARTTVVEETELFAPEFDVEGFARRLAALSGMPALRDLVFSMLPVAPPPVAAAALRVLTGLVKAGEELPKSVLEAANSPEPAVQEAALAVLAAAQANDELLARLDSVPPKQADFILEQLEKSAHPPVDRLRRLFTEQPAPRLALALARMGASGIHEDIVSLLMEDTPLALAANRGLLLEALFIAKGTDETFRRAVEGELWHPLPSVRCAALRFSDEKTRQIWAQAAAEWEVRACAGKKPQ